MDKTYIFGHRNPDTDSVAAAISLSYLKNRLGHNTTPAVLSSINLETQYALNYFNVSVPIFLNDVKIKVKDLDYIRNYSVTEEDSISDAYFKMIEAKISKIPVVDSEKKLLGIITMNDIAKEQFSDNIDLIDSTYQNIIETLDGKEILRFDEQIKGNLTAAGYRSTTILNSVKLDSSSILIVGDRHSVIEYAVQCGIKLLIITGNHEVKPEHLEIAKTNRVNIIVSPHKTIIVSRKINLANSVSMLSYKKDILCVYEHDNVSDFAKLANKTRYSYYPTLNEKEECTGIIRASDVTYDKKKKVILVDHNSYEQSALGLDETEILEIIDHHNIGSIGTNMPINFRNMPVGSSNTIIYMLYKENNVGIPEKMAGLMLSGILSDTLILTSPTTTDLDEEAVVYLASLAGVDYREYGLNMLKAGSTVKGKTKEEVLYTDYKTYPVREEKIGLGQISTTNPEEILEEKEAYIELLNNVAKNNDYRFVALFITDIIGNGSYVIYSEAAEITLRKAFKNPELTQGDFIDNVVSRKKQILPNLMLELQ